MKEATRQRRNERARVRRKGWQRIITRLGTSHAVAGIERGYDSERRCFAKNDVMTLCGKRLRLSSQQYLKESGPLSCAECQFARRAIDTVTTRGRTMMTTTSEIQEQTTAHLRSIVAQTADLIVTLKGLPPSPDLTAAIQKLEAANEGLPETVERLIASGVQLPLVVRNLTDRPVTVVGSIISK
jgi:hypothetical protein